MKISPMPANAGGTPGTDLGNVHVGSTASTEKLAMAKAIAMGQEPERKEEKAEPEKDLSIRRITMRTKASPEQYLPESEPTEAIPAVETPTSTIADASGQTNAAESTQPLSPQFAALAKQRRALQVKERELAEREAKVGKPPEGEYISKAEIDANPLKLFEGGFISYEKLTEAVLSDQSGHNPEIKAVQAELKALKEGVDKRFASEAEIQEESALNQIANDIEAFSKEGDDYELFRARNGLERALNKIYSHYKKTGQVLDNKAVADQIETELLDEAVQLGNFKKVKSKLAPEPVQAPQLQGKQMKTLTNRDGSSVPLSRKARAMAAFHNQLRK